MQLEILQRNLSSIQFCQFIRSRIFHGNRESTTDLLTKHRHMPCQLCKTALGANCASFRSAVPSSSWKGCGGTSPWAVLLHRNSTLPAERGRFSKDHNKQAAKQPQDLAALPWFCMLTVMQQHSALPLGSRVILHLNNLVSCSPAAQERTGKSLLTALAVSVSIIYNIPVHFQSPALMYTGGWQNPKYY